MKKGFTLMEILAVILLLAVILSMAVPVLRTVRFEIKNAQAKVAAKKLAEGYRKYYHDSRSHPWVTACFTPATDNVIKTPPSACVSLAATGIPRQSSSVFTNAQHIEQMFACGYLSYKDFVSLPYTFCTYRNTAAGGPPEPTGLTGGFQAFAYGTSATAAGEKYAPSKGYIFVDGRMEALDTYD